MPDPQASPDADFDAELRGLFQQAQQELAGREKAAAPVLPESATEPEPSAKAAPKPVPASTLPAAPAGFTQMLRPLVLGIAAMTRAAGENNTILHRLDKSSSAATDASRDMPALVSELRSALELRNGVSHRMFDALHEELKGYKDGFLLESVHRPIIRDMLTLFDDVTEIHRQIDGLIADHAATVREHADCTLALLERLKTLEINLENNLDFILEVLARLEVTPLPLSTGKLDKKMQRAVAVELAEDPEEDSVIVRTVKRGFLWKDRVLRPEEVVIKKWKEGFLMAMPPPSGAVSQDEPAG